MENESTSGAATATAPPPELINQIADTVATLVAARTGGGAQPTVQVVSGDTDVTALSALNGAFKIRILIGTATYSLEVKIPGNGTYEFSLTEKSGEKPAVTLASFIFKNGENWKVVVTLPALTIGNVTLEELSITLGMGTVAP